MAFFRVDPATEADIPIILDFIKQLAEFERLADDVVATHADIRSALFSDRPVAEALVGRCGVDPVGFALFFSNFSTFLGRPGIHLEDLYVQPDHRGRGFGHKLLAEIARLACERGCSRVEWSVLNWNNRAIDTYRRAGAVPMDRWTVYRLAGAALERLGRQKVG